MVNERMGRVRQLLLVWFGWRVSCSWNSNPVAREHYNRSNFLNIFNFRHIETAPDGDAVRPAPRLGLMSTFDSKTVNDVNQRALKSSVVAFHTSSRWLLLTDVDCRVAP